MAGGDLVAIAILPGLLLPPTVVAIGIFLWRTGTAAWWSAALLIAGGGLFIVAFPGAIEPLAVIADGLFVLALFPIGRSMLAASRAAARATAPPATPM